jgi:outer membrane protein assembly factor BamA
MPSYIKMFFKSIILNCILLIIGANSFAQKDSSKKLQILVFPVLTRSIETSWSFGVAGTSTFRMSKSDTLSRTSNLQTILLYSLKKQLVAAINGAQYFKNEQYVLNEQLSYSSFPDKFWGLGNQTLNQAEEAYDFKQFYTYLHLMRKMGKGIFIGGIYEYQNLLETNYKAGGIFDQQQVVGRGGYHISGLGLSFTYDTRNNAFAPDKGNFAQIYFNHFSPVFGSNHRYTNIVVDLRKYMTIRKNGVLALQAYSFNNTGNDVPLRSLATLGGMNSMRGYYDGRYRDKNQLVFQAEFRQNLYKRFGMVAFGNMGDVSHGLSYQLSDLKYTVGAGLRYALNKSEKLNIRLDYGIGPGKNQGFYFELGEAF